MQEETMSDTIPQPSGDDEALWVELRQWQRQVAFHVNDTDSLGSALEARIIALEEILAARWPWRLLAAARLGREVRRSALMFAWAGPSFYTRRLEATSNEWLCAARRPGGVPG